MAKVSYWSSTWYSLSPDLEDHLVPDAVHEWIFWGFGPGDLLTITAHPGHFNREYVPQFEQTLAVENIRLEEDTAGRRAFFDVRNVGADATFGYLIGIAMIGN